MKIMKNRFLKVMVVAVFAAAGWMNFSYAEEAAIPEAVNKVKDHLVNAAGESVDGAALAEKPYLLIYYSAHWCPPCRKFTPKLVEFYNTHKGGEAFEIVFVSSDHSEEDMFKYMKELEMPWLAVKYDDIEKSDVESYASAYIPYLVMFDREGHLIEGTPEYVNGTRYIIPESVLEELKKRI